MLWQLFIAIFVPFIPVEPTITRVYATPKFRVVFECDGFETPFEFAREMAKENRDILTAVWSYMRLFYSESVAGKQLAEKEI
jgi:hypothetical protein